MSKYNIVGVISSPRFNGNTATLVREALKGAEKEGAVITEIFLPKYDLDYCTGCSKCLTDGKCPISDEFTKIRDILYNADAIIWASPTYCGTYNAIMKNFIERLGLYEVMTSSLGGKYFAGISSASSASSAKKVAKSLASITSNGVFKRGYISGILGVGLAKGMESKNNSDFIKAQKLGSKLCRDIKEARSYPVQNLFLRFISTLIIKPRFIKYIYKEKENSTKAVYTNLVQRGLI